MSASPKRALLLAPYFLPRRRVGAMRPFRFVLHLRDFGWRPTVLTIAAEGQQLTAKEARLLDEVEIIRLHPPFDRSTSAESQLRPSSGGSPPDDRSGAAGLARKKIEAWGERLLEGFDRQFPVDTWLPFFLLKYRRLAQVVRRVRPHVMWSTGDPWSGPVMGAHLAQRFGVPHVADLRDPWTLSPVRGQKKVLRAVDRWCERRVLRTSRAVVFTARQTEAAYRRHYAALDLQTTTIYNSFDRTLFDDPVGNDENARGAPASSKTTLDGPLDIGFFGRFRALSPAAPIADALAAARRRHGAGMTGAIRVFSFGPLGKADARYARRLGVRGQFHRREAVPLEEALAVLRRFDLLLLSTAPRRSEIVPAKLWEYLAAGRPVLSLSTNPEVARLLDQTGTGVQIAPGRSEAIADLLADCVEARRAGRTFPVPFTPDANAIKQFEARAATRRLADVFDRAAATPTPGRPLPSSP
ncbi:MAG: hypothetical protein BRD52_00110 [Bacteroidetes bacterium SW_4_67_19]|nr:MAG: hypothetical protein BRD52_00110 [Bacteroidetes bacterium SW_4_67_19]